MSDIRFTVNVTNDDIITDVRDAITDGINDATGKRSPNGISDAMENIAEERIISTNSVWRGELLDSFSTQHARAGGGWIIDFENDADHAPAINYGADYDEKGPPVESLIPWVQTNMPAHPVTGEFTDPGPDGEGLPENLQQYDPAVVANAFWLQQQIKRRGIRGIHFMDAAEEWAEDAGDNLVAAKILSRVARL